jgi:uncharacterized protein (TIGR02996 family)
MTAKISVPIIHKAVSLPGEFPFISAIAADLLDDTPKLVYADWLEEHDDPRSVFLRKLVEVSHSAAKNLKWPTVRGQPRAWVNMIGYHLLRAIHENGFVAAKDAILNLAKPTVTIETKHTKESAISLGGSKFGGHPDLPAKVEWPRCGEGPLGFLCQIALPDLQDTQISHSLPKDGMLLFFAYQSYVTGIQAGNIQNKGDLTRVIYTPANVPFQRRDPPDDLKEEGNQILPACRLTMCEDWDLPEAGDRVPDEFAADMDKLVQIKEAMFKEDKFEEWSALYRDCRTYGNHLLGCSVHNRTDDPSPGREWMHLLCLDSDDNLGWSWCDGEHLAVYVHEEDLRNRSFARVFGYAS